MRGATVAAVVVVVAVLGGALALSLAGGLPGSGDAATLRATWTSDTGVVAEANHHEVAVGTLDGEGRVFVPRSSTGDEDACALLALSAADGSEQWRDRVPRANCTIHAVADPTVADYDGDGTAEVLSTTTESVVIASEPGGAVERRWNLSSYGYTKPIVADVTGGGAAEVVVADAHGLVQVLDADGGVAWSVDREGFVWGTPAVADADDDGAVEVVVAGSDGAITAYRGDGTVEWSHGLDGEQVTWLASADADGDDVAEFYAASADGNVFAVDGTGERAWRASRGDLAATSAVLADDRGVGVFVTARDGTVARLNADTGDVVWETTVAAEPVRMMPPPVAGDVDGDPGRELVVAANDGTLTVLDPATGDTVATRSHDGGVLAAPVLEDVDGDGRDEVFVVYADGTVRRFDYE